MGRLRDSKILKKNKDQWLLLKEKYVNIYELKILNYMETLGGLGEKMYSEEMLVNYDGKDVPIGQLFEIMEQIEETCSADEIIYFRENVRKMLQEPSYVKRFRKIEKNI